MHEHAHAPIRRKGYTLIELLIVIAILGLAGALLVPRLVQQDSMTAQAAVRKLIGDLSFAQSDALAHQEYRRVHFYADGSGYCIIRVNDSNFGDDWATFDPADIDYINDPLAPANEDGRYITNFTTDARFAQVRITSVDIDDGVADPAGDIIYDSLGGTLRPDGTPGIGGDIVLSANADAFTIGVSPFTGKLTVE